eukprot:scaffold1339_cov207-Alexandrium_tamarense.AAC.11
MRMVHFREARRRRCPPIRPSTGAFAVRRHRGFLGMREIVLRYGGSGGWLVVQCLSYRWVLQKEYCLFFYDACGA